ncbi:MAG TPA: hypothetical protein PLO65_07750 [Caulobacter sp.]|nr:hypothetical protein [Caulobacter sp.]
MRQFNVPLFAFAALSLSLLASSPALAGESCHLEKGDSYRLTLSPEITRQGSVLTVGALSAGGQQDTWGGRVALGCLKGWTVSDPGLATLSADHSTLTLAADAPPGARVTLSARLAGKPVVAEITVVARDAVVLTGFWKEVGDADCPLGSPSIMELHFLPGGKFELTWQPFERYVDYWGDYSFDPGTGAVTFRPTGGNHVPGDADWEGRATVGADGLLRFSDLFFGSPSHGPRPPTTCIVFKAR